jgi:hypothetical protein
MGWIGWARERLSGYLRGDAVAAPDEGGGLPALSRRFRVTVPELPATAGAPGRARAVYYVYGQTRAEALARLPAALVAGAVVEEAGYVEGGVLVFPDDERATVFDGREVPGTPGPVK